MSGGFNKLSGLFGLEPFDPKKHKAQDMGLGGLSTEYVATAFGDDGNVINYPRIWFDGAGKAVLLDEETALSLSQEYEKQTGNYFPRFTSTGQASERAMHRSAMGGAGHNKLAQFGRQR